MSLQTSRRPHSPATTFLSSKVLWASAALLAVPLAIRAALGTQSRYASDDYCWPVQLAEHGFLGLQADVYMNAFGRWASTLLLSLNGYLGDGSAALLPAVALVLWVAALAWLGYELTGRLAISTLVAEVIVLATLTAAPDGSLQSLYWQSGMLTYLPPFVLAPAGAAAALRFDSPVIAAAAAFVVAGFNESFMVLELATLTVAALIVRGERRSLLVAALLGAVLSAVLVVVSPGNAARRDDLEQFAIWLVPAATLFQVLKVGFSALLSPLGVGLVLMGAVLAPHITIYRWLGVKQVLGAACLLTFVAILPSVFGVGGLQSRTAIVPVLPLVLGAGALGIAVGHRLALKVTQRELLMASALFMAVATWQTLTLAPGLSRFENSWSAWDAELSAAGPEDHLVIAPPEIPFEGVWQIGSDPDFVINRCVAGHYDVASVSAP